MSLTHNGVREIIVMQSNSSDPAFQPILQVISIKPVANNNGVGVNRYRAVLSDGEHFVQGMLATQFNELVDNDELQVNSLIQVQEFMNNNIQGRSVIILLKFQVVGNPQQRIGQPVDIEKAGNAAMNAGAAPSSNSNQPAAPMYNRTNNNAAASTATATTNPYSPGKPKANPYSPPAGSNPYGGSNRTTTPSAPVVRNSTTPSGTQTTMISQLNMYQNRWTLKARVTSKSDIRTWSNAKGEGSLFSMELLDSSGMDIRATLFKEGVDKFYNFLTVGNIYTFAGGRLKVANMQYNTCKSQLEITFDQNSEIHLQDDAGEIQAQSFEFVKIADIEKVEAGKNIDVLGVIQEIGQVATLTSKKTGQDLQKCDVTLVDDSNAQIRITLWGNQAVNAHQELEVHKVAAFRRARVSDFGGKSLSAGNNAFIEPQVPETQVLQQWWATQGSAGGAIKSLSSSGGMGGRMDTFSERKEIADIKSLNLGHDNEKGDFISFKAHFTFLKKDKEGGAWYTACPNKEEPCRRRCKVTQTTDGNWQCDRCQNTYPDCTRKWIFSATIADDTSSTWVSLFDEQAMQLFGGITADEVFAQYDNQDVYDGHFAKAAYTEWIFKCRVKKEMVNDEPRIKSTILRMDPVDYASECKDLLQALEKFKV
jgi:replication factor A1